ncbi:MAG: glycosyltransferase family 39 protein [Nocardioides sp.]
MTEQARRRDPIGPLLALASAALFVARGFDGILSRDLALYAYAGQRVAAGDPPYVGVMNRSGPLAHLVPGFGAWWGDLVGMDDLLAMRLVMLVLSALTVWATYALARRVLDSRPAAAVAAFAIATIPGWIFYAAGGPREKTTMVLLLTLTLAALLARRWTAAGVCLALATLTWQPVFFPGAVTALAIALASAERLRALVRIAFGGMATTLAFVAYFLVVGALPEALDGFIRIHLAYTRQPGFGDDDGRIWEQTLNMLGMSTYILIAGLIALPLVTLVMLIQARLRRELDWNARFLIAATLGEIAGLAWSYRTFNGWADALVLVPYAVLGLAGVATLLVRHLPWRVGTVLAIAGCLALGAIGVQYVRSDSENFLPKQRAEIDRVLEVLPDATMVSIEAPQALVLAHRVNPSQHQMFRLGLQRFVNDTWPGGLRGYGDWIAQQRPDLVLVGQKAKYRWLMRTLDEDYTEFGKSPGWYWFVRNDVDDETLASLGDSVRG